VTLSDILSAFNDLTKKGNKFGRASSGKKARVYEFILKLGMHTDLDWRDGFEIEKFNNGLDKRSKVYHHNKLK
jgi:hypothetical protein